MQNINISIHLVEKSETQETVNIAGAEQTEEEDEEEDPQFVEKDDDIPLSEIVTKSQKSTKSKSNINREILEDWEEDTDSQQSEKQQTTKDNDNQEETESDNSKDGKRQAAVDKLMNDWEDEEDDDKRDQ